MSSPAHRGLLLGVAITCGSYAVADAPLPAAQLREYCVAWKDAPGSPAAAACVAYVQGFLDGATAVDGRIRPQAEATADSLVERARRTRLAPARMQRPPYCVDASLPLAVVIHQILLHYDSRKFGGELEAHVLVASTLRRFHPC